MGKLSAGFEFTGSIGNVTAYKMKGVDRLVVRQKGGASKEKIKTSPRFAGTRRQNAEFGGRSSGASWVKHGLWQLKPLADFNILNSLNKIVKNIQEMDTVSVLGQRSIEFTKAPQQLEGFSFNNGYSFDSTVRHPLRYDIDRESFTAGLSIPALKPGIHFFPNSNAPMFRIQATLALIPNLFYADPKYKPSDKNYHKSQSVMVATPWQPVQQGMPADTLELHLKVQPPNDEFVLVLGVGISYGRVTGINEVEQLKHTGAAKILSAK